MDDVLTSSWGRKAFDEARRVGGAHARLAVDSRKYSKDNVTFDNIPLHGMYSFSRVPGRAHRFCKSQIY